MTTNELRNIIDGVLSWPEDDQRELAEYARIIEARRTGVYRVTEEERAILLERLAEADRGDFASDEFVADFDRLVRS